MGSLRNNSIIILPQVKSKSNALGCIPQPTPIESDISSPNEADKSTPSEVELCLLLCSMFPQGFRLPIDDLVMFGMALNLFRDVHDMSRVRCKVDDLIKIINHRLPLVYRNKLCLWEDKYGNRYVKVLGSAHDLAKSIASTYGLAFCSKTIKRTWPTSRDWEKYCYGLSLVLERINVNEHPFECPKLALLHLQHTELSQSIPAGLFEGIKELLVLSLDVPLLPRSLDVLSNLRMLCLKVLRFEDMSCIGGLINLEFLSISTPTLTDIPKEMGQLCNLRFLDLRNMNVAWIPPGVVLRMLKLEELYFPLNFTRWGCRAQEHNHDYDEWGSWGSGANDYDDKGRTNASSNGDRTNASIIEILSRSLNALQIVVPKASILPKNAPIFKNMKWFRIFVPNNLKYRPLGQYSSLNVLQLAGDARDIKESGICDLMRTTGDLNLSRVQNLNNVVFELEDNDFPQLQKMIISECDELEYIVDVRKKKNVLSKSDCFFSRLESLHLSLLFNLKEIWHGRRTKSRSFVNLSQISIRFCHKLKYVFPLSIFKGCALLKSIEILNCNGIKGIFYQDNDDCMPFEHYSIEELDLHSLPKLVGFFVCDDIRIERIYEDVTDRLSTNEVSPIKNNYIISHIETYNAFSSILTEKWLRSLKRLKIAYCDAIQVIFLFEKNIVTTTTTTFNSLKELELYGLRNLMHIWFSVPVKIIAFQNLQLLVLSECHNSYVFSLRVAKLLVRLQKLYITHCDKMEEIIVKDDESETENKIIFPQLKLLELQHMPNLRTFSSGIYPVELSSMEALKLNQCNKMQSFSNGSLWTPLLEIIQINESLYSISGDLNATIQRFHSPSKDSTISTNTSGSSASSQLFPKQNPNKPQNSYYCTEDAQTSPFSSVKGQVHRIGKWSFATSRGGVVKGPNYMKEFTFTDLQIATNNFSSDTLLGKVGLGEIYKGWLDEKTFSPSKTGTGLEIVIKKFNPNSKQLLQSNVSFHESQSHPNLVKLVGHCLEDRELLLVYECNQRGSLYDNLNTRNPGIKPLSWDVRIKIAIGAARGLSFLHSYGKKVIQVDIKSANILLDSNYNAKVSCFDWVRMDPARLSTAFKKTRGFIDPMYFRRGQVNVKSNVHGYGMVLLELLRGLKAFDIECPKGQHDLVHWLKKFLSNEETRFKQKMGTSSSGLLTAMLAWRCVQDDHGRHPTMRQVLQELQKIDEVKEKEKGEDITMVFD